MLYKYINNYYKVIHEALLADVAWTFFFLMNALIYNKNRFYVAGRAAWNQ